MKLSYIQEMTIFRGAGLGRLKENNKSNPRLPSTHFPSFLLLFLLSHNISKEYFQGVLPTNLVPCYLGGAVRGVSKAEIASLGNFWYVVFCAIDTHFGPQDQSLGSSFLHLKVGILEPQDT